MGAPLADAPAPDGPVLTLDGVSKGFPGVQALDGVRLAVRAGEVHALIGENGAGKSTLVKILTGILAPDAGTLTLGGRAVRFAPPIEADRAGIAAIHQETVLFEELSVAENVFLGHQPTRLWRGPGAPVDWRAVRGRTAALLAEIGLAVDPATSLGALGIAERHLVVVARALVQEARVLILDEPTAALSQGEIEALFALVRRLRDAGGAIVFISHKFDEIFAIADRYTVLRDGRFAGEGATRDVDQDALVAMMVGRALGEVFPKARAPMGEVVLEVEGLSHPTEFDDVSFAPRRGQILGFCGLVGAGRSEVMRALFGLTAPSRGRVRIDGSPRASPRPGTPSPWASPTSPRAARSTASSCPSRGGSTSPCRASARSRAGPSSPPRASER